MILYFANVTPIIELYIIIIKIISNSKSKVVVCLRLFCAYHLRMCVIGTHRQLLVVVR